jgi:hypothetical protein
MAEKHQDPKATHTQGASVASKTWHFFNRPDAAAVVAWLNTSPAQQAGEAFASSRPDGSIDAYAFF